MHSSLKDVARTQERSINLTLIAARVRTTRDHLVFAQTHSKELKRRKCVHRTMIGAEKMAAESTRAISLLLVYSMSAATTTK